MADVSEPTFVYPVSGKYVGSSSPDCQSQLGYSGLPLMKIRLSLLKPKKANMVHLFTLSAYPSTFAVKCITTLSTPLLSAGAADKLTLPAVRSTV